MQFHNPEQATDSLEYFTICQNPVSLIKLGITQPKMSVLCLPEGYTLLPAKLPVPQVRAFPSPFSHLPSRASPRQK